MRTVIKNIMDGILHPAGLNIERFFGDNLDMHGLAKLANDNYIDLLLDIGANTGQFSKKIIQAGFSKKIISFEPLSEAYAKLKENAKKFSNWQVFDRCAIGNIDGNIEINISQNSHSSSILQVNTTHTDAAPTATFIDKENVAIYKLDSIRNQFSTYKNILLKIDTQGFEKNVLLGARDLLNEKVKLIQLEMSLLPLYEGAACFDEMLNFLKEINFEPLFYTPGFVDRTTNRIQQLEGYFIKKIY